MKIIGIAGGSGAGKSAVSYWLADTRPDTFEVLNLDDYQKLKTDKTLPMRRGKINWDHPDAIRWQDLMYDLDRLKAGHPVTIQAWSHRSNPDYHKHGTMIARTIRPKSVLVVEGYLALYNAKLNRRYTRKYYIDLDEETRLTRRKTARGGKSNVIGDEAYEQEVLAPMHKAYVEPTKANADRIIPVIGKSVSQVAAIIEDDLGT